MHPDVRRNRSGPWPRPGTRVRRLAVAVSVAGLIVIVTGACGARVSRPGSPARHPAPAGVAALPAPTGTLGPAPFVAAPQTAAPESAAPHSVARPVSLSIPLIGVHTRLITLGITRDGSLQVPPTTSVAGWFTGSPRPGAPGSAIIAGHINSYRGPGVFVRLDELRPGNRIYVRRSDGTRVVFRVTAVHRYLKDHFPTQTVYGATPDVELRLITCGGAFDSVTGHYLSNVVVYATQAS
ncbi:MAG TPA: class F sortase [Streptosporangiaceae bacterium]|nr:class F sortase [Streptosporangiaceae bacterium]